MSKAKPGYISARIQGKLKDDFVKKCEREGMSQSEAIRYAIRKWVES